MIAAALSVALREERPGSSFIRWAGSKRQLVPHLAACAPRQFARYIEPFAGSASLFFHIRPAKAILSDINADLINAYRQVRDHPEGIGAAVRSLSTSKSAYYRIRAASSTGMSSFERAVRFLYLNRHSFNAVYRVNRSGHFNVPRGKNAGAVPSTAVFQRCAVLLKNADLRVGDFEETLSKAKVGDFVYLDPPYFAKRDTHGEYGYNSFHQGDIDRLLASLCALDDAGVHFLLSYSLAGSQQLRRKRWTVREVRVKRHIAGFSHARRRAHEVLIANYPLPVRRAR